MLFAMSEHTLQEPGQITFMTFTLSCSYRAVIIVCECSNRFVCHNAKRAGLDEGA